MTEGTINLSDGGASAPLSRPEEKKMALSLAGPSDFFALLKPRVMSLVIFTALAGMVAAPGAVQNWPLALLSLFCIAVGAGASGALNMWWDADIDAVMERTKSRPIPAGLIPRAEVFGFGLFLSILSVFLLALTANYVAAGLLAFTIFFYAVIYSMYLKRATPQNIVIGGAAGALPPVVGWAAVTGTVSIDALLLFLVIFLWTPPHFWALALVKKGDYEAAGIPMMPNAKGDPHTRKLIWIYSLVLVATAVGVAFRPVAGAIYLAVALFGGVGFLVMAWRVWRGQAPKDAWRLFAFSIFYLFALFASLLIEHWTGMHG